MDKRLLLIILILILIPSVNAEYWDSGETLYGNHSYDWCLINGTLNIAPYNTTAGTGYLNLTCSDWINVTAIGDINGDGDGGRGGAGGSVSTTPQYWGEAGEGLGAGSGGNSGGVDALNGGGGAGYGGNGGTSGAGTGAGSSYGTLGGQAIENGSGGGGGGFDTDEFNNGGAGGDGGASLLLYSLGDINVQGTISMDGADGSIGAGSDGGAGGGGAGSGGGVILIGRDVDLDSGTITVTGGDGGDSGGFGMGKGGGGGAGGRIKVFYKVTISNTSITVTKTGGTGGTGDEGAGGTGNVGTIYYEDINTAPTLDLKELYPASPSTSDDLLLNVTCSDADAGDTLTAYWDIYNGSGIQSSLSSSQVVTSGTETEITVVTSRNTTKADTWLAEVLCDDGTVNTSRGNTSTRTIANSLPHADMITATDTNYTSSSQTLQARAWDLDADTLSGNITCNTTNVSNTSMSNYTTTDFVFSLSDGNYDCYFTVSDGTDNNVTSNISILVDTISPAITINIPANTTYDSYSVDVNVSSDGTDDSWWYEFDSNGTNQTFTPNDSLSGISDGQHNLTVYVNDSVGNENSSTVYFTVDTAQPYQLDLNSPVDNYNSSNQSIVFNWTCYDALTNMSSNLTIDDVVNVSGISTNNGTPTTQQVNGLSEADHNWSIKCYDDAGNSNTSSTRNFTVDLSPPDSFSNAVATPNAINERQTTIITVTVTDVLLDVDTTIMEVTNPLSSKTNFTMTKSGSVFTSSISGTNTDVVGTYYVDFYANDTVGNMNYSNYNLIFQVSQATTSGGGGGGGSPTVSAFTKRLNVITSETMVDAIKELKLVAKRFCRVDRHIAAVFAVTGWKTGDYPATETDISGALANPVVDVEGDVYETSASEVLKAWKSADTVVIARGDLEVDSIAAIAYAKVSNVPILLTKPGELPSVTLDAVKKLNVKSFVIIGGEGAVSGEVADELHKLGSVARIAGDSRHETAVEIAKALEKLKDIDTIVIADGEKPGMDTAIIAAGYDAPVLYVSGDIVPQGTKDFAKAHRLTKRGKEVRLVFVDVSGYIINYRLDKDF